MDCESGSATRTPSKPTWPVGIRPRGSRFFAPAAGVNEDPVTGSAHCCLSEWWGERLAKAEMTGYQASERGGVVRVRRANGRVKLIGRAVTVTHGHLAAVPT